MWKTLLKKQFLETLSFFLGGDKKSGKRRSPWLFVGLGLLMAYALVAIVFLFLEISKLLCAPLVQSGLSWVFFAIMGTMAAALGCVVSILASKTQLYEAKDNELLLSMPIPPKVILCTRMLGLYLMTWFLFALVFIPTSVYYFTVAGFSVLAAIFCLLITFIAPLGVLAISCLLGWLIAIITARVAKKNLITTLLLVLFLIGYSVGYSKINELLTYLIANGGTVAGKFQTALYPFWQMGLAATGEPLGMLIFTAIFVALFALVYCLLSATFLQIVTQKRAGKKAKYRGGERKSRTAFSALLSKEAKRFLKNPMILFNAGIGAVISVVFCGFALFNTELCAQINAAPVDKGLVATILTSITCFIVSSNVITASSVSLEGDNLWVLRSMPVETKEILNVKVAFHVLYSAIPSVFAQALICILLKIPFFTAVLAVGVLVVTSVVCAVMGLMINLKLPNLKWTSEIVAVKQSASTLAAMFAGWGVAALVLGGHFLFGKYLYAEIYFLIVIAVFTAVSVALLAWLKKRGVVIFESL